MLLNKILVGILWIPEANFRCGHYSTSPRILFAQAFDTLETQRGRCCNSDLRACGAGRRKSGKEEHPMTVFTFWVAMLIIACIKYFLAHRLMK